jgi:hypothetical protein
VSLEKKIGIEPLGDARWARVERAVFRSLSEGDAAAQAEPPAATVSLVKWRGAPALVLAGALATALGALMWKTIGPSDSSAGPTRVATAANGSRIELGESTVDVGPQSDVRLTGDDVHGISVFLDVGRVECDVAPRRGRPPFLVEAGTVEVRVIGTHFVVTRTGDAVSVDVQRGRVEVFSGQEHAFVGAGAHWPGSAASPIPSHAAPGPSAEGTSQVSPPEATRAPEGPARAAAQDPRAAAPTPTHLSPRDQYEAASKLEAQKPGAALARYNELAAQGGAWGMNALFAAGRLEADRGRRGDATRILQEYLASYPLGPNAEDARRLLARIR